MQQFPQAKKSNSAQHITRHALGLHQFAILIKISIVTRYEALNVTESTTLLENAMFSNKVSKHNSYTSL